MAALRGQRIGWEQRLPVRDSLLRRRAQVGKDSKVQRFLASQPLDPKETPLLRKL